MSGDDETPEDRTVFIPATPSGADPPVPPAAGWPPIAGPETAASVAVPETAVTPTLPPGGSWSAPPPAEPVAAPVDIPGPTSFDPQKSYVPMAPRRDGDRIQTGDVLNHIFEVRRFIARGGMGEVFEGINVTSDERVAIKVMLPSLAADPNIQAMFRKEARTLTRLSHPALVQYRVLAQEPQLGVLYIVTEFIDGTNLSDVLGTIQADEAQLRMLARRLADGLRIAHGLGAIHRDISPDNVLLEGGRLDRAKVIDFGIAKDLDPSSRTIVGDGFAGKLGYVAPEQLGDFGREVGPWSDVYSLGLVILAVALGKNVDMGATLVEAVDRRRAGPDLSPVPAPLRPVISAMLTPNPADRLRSMDAVIAALDGAAQPVDAPPIAKPGDAVKRQNPVVKKDPVAPKSKTPLLVGGGVAALLVAGAGVYFATRGPAENPAVAAADPVTSTEPADVTAHRAILAALPAINCSWLEIGDVRLIGAEVRVAMNGVADSPGRAQAAISRALAAKGITASDISFEDVATVPTSACTPLDAFRSIQAHPPVPSLDVRQRKWELEKDASGVSKVDVVLNVDLGPVDRGVALFGMQENGTVEVVDEPPNGRQSSHAQLEALLSSLPTATRQGGSRWRVRISAPQAGWSGLILLSGRDPFDPKLIAAKPAERPADWRQRFDAAAQAGGWQAEMVWYRAVDEIPG